MKSILTKAISVLTIIFLSTGCATAPKLSTTQVNRLKRIHYTQEDQYRVINLFYASARKTDTEINSPGSFKAQLGQHTTYGSANVKINPSLTIGSMLPAWYKNNDIIGVKNIIPLAEDEFIKKLSEAVNRSPHKSLLIQVSGYKDNFEYTAIKSAYFSYLLDVDTPTLFFDWPGDQPVNIRGYLKAERVATQSGQYLSGLLIKIIREVKPDKLWIFGSSLGAHVICSAFDEMYKEKSLIDEGVKIDHVILAAPDVRKREFDIKFKDQIAALADSLTVYVSSNDRALLLSSILDRHGKLGRQPGARLEKQEQYEEVKGLLYLKSLEPDRINLVDVTPINKATYRHGYYLEAPYFFDELYLRIFEKPPHVNRRLYLIKTEDGLDYWILRSGD